ncbi:hypothetical protein ACOI4E_06545 [Escherichia coli]
MFREAHLVEPNLQWAWRYRLLRTRRASAGTGAGFLVVAGHAGQPAGEQRLSE